MTNKNLEDSLNELTDKIRHHQNEKLEHLTEQQLDEYIEQTNQEAIDYAKKIGIKTVKIGEDEE